MDEAKERHDFSVLVNRVLALAAEKFRDPVSGLPAQFLMSFSVNETGPIAGYYWPILNNWGFTETNSIVLGDTCDGFSLPWTHEDSVRWLIGANDGDIANMWIDSEGGWKAGVGGPRAGSIFFTDLPLSSVASHQRIISGGTRQGATIVSQKMRRLWDEFRLVHYPESCRFCGPMEGEVVVEKGNLRYFANISTPYSWHWLIVPTKGFLLPLSADNLYTLYSADFLDEVFAMAAELVKKRPHLDYPAELGIHVGPLAGQNMAHPHFGLLQR